MGAHAFPAFLEPPGVDESDEESFVPLLIETEDEWDGASEES